jgi:hypothetical protein
MIQNQHLIGLSGFLFLLFLAFLIFVAVRNLLLPALEKTKSCKNLEAALSFASIIVETLCSVNDQV